MKKLLTFIFCLFWFLLFSNTVNATVILETDFSDGTINPFTYWKDGNAYYRVLSPSQDPLGTGEWCVELNYPTDTEGRSSLLYRSSGYQEINISLHWMTPYANDTDWTHVFNIEYWKDGLKSGEFLTLDVYHSQWRIQYYNEGTSYRRYEGSVQPNRKYFIEARIRLGYTDGEVEVKIDGTTILLEQGLNNARLAEEINAYEVGCFWGQNLKVYVYDVKLEGGNRTFELVNVTGRVVDEQGNPISTVGIRVGLPQDPQRPWIANRYYENFYSDSNGYFSFRHPKTIIPEIKFIKPGYGDPTEPVGSITRIKNINLTQAGNTYNLGNIVLKSRPIIQPSSRPNGTYWPFRSVVIFPYQNPYSSQGYLNTLDTLKQRLGDEINIIDLRFPTGSNASGMPIHDDNIEDGRYSYSELAAAIDGAHARGFKVMLTNGWYSAGDPNLPGWWNAFKELALERAKFAADHKVEYYVIAFEIAAFDDPKNNEKALEVLRAVRDYANSRGDWNPKIVYMGSLHLKDEVINLTYFKEHTWLLDPSLDIIGVESWLRAAGVLDPTEEEISQGWRYGISWDWHPEPPDILQVYSQMVEWAKKPIILNFGYGTWDGSALQWGVKPSVQDQEEQALCYKVSFDMLQNLSLHGWAMEHYSFAPSNTTTTGCFRETIAEGFIKFGLDSHSKNFTFVEGKIKDKYENPVKASIFAFRQNSDIIVDSFRSKINGSYRLELTPGYYDLLYNFTNFSTLFFIKILSLNLTSSLLNPINYLTYSLENKISFVFNGTGNQLVQVYSYKKPNSIKLDGNTLPYDESLSSTPSWNFNETNKILTIKFSC